jgi:hypothetical protein
MDFLATAELNNLTRFIAERDAALIKKATAGMGTDDGLVIAVMCGRTKHQIFAIDQAYRAAHGESLKSVINKECGGNYGTFLQYLCESRGQFLANQFKEAVDGVGCNKDLINEIFCLSSGSDLEDMKVIYEQQKDKSIADVIRKELSGEHEKLILRLLSNPRPNSSANPAEAASEARKLYTIISKGAIMKDRLKDSAEVKVWF